MDEWPFWMFEENIKLVNEIVEEDEYMDPWEKQYRDVNKRLQSFEESQALQEIEKTVSRLQSNYGEDFDPNEVVAKALARCCVSRRDCDALGRRANPSSRAISKSAPMTAPHAR